MDSKIENAFGRLDAALARLEARLADTGNAQGSSEEITAIRSMIGEAISLIGNGNAAAAVRDNGTNP